MNNSKLGETIEQAAINYGFDSCCIIPINFMDSFEINLKKRVEAVPSTASFYSYSLILRISSLISLAFASLNSQETFIVLCA